MSSYLKGRDLKAIDVDWITDTTPIVGMYFISSVSLTLAATTDGCIRILDRSLSTSNSPFNHNTLPKPIYTPYLLPPNQALHLKVLLQHYIKPSKFSYDVSPVDMALFESVDPKVKQDISAASGIAAKCLVVARYYGSEEGKIYDCLFNLLSEIRFWMVAQWALQRYTSNATKPSEIPKEAEDKNAPETTTVTTIGYLYLVTLLTSTEGPL
jgi:hypothetical protein